MPTGRRTPSWRSNGASRRRAPCSPGWDADLPKWKPGESLATRVASGKSINAIAKKIPWLLGGDADLSESTKTKIEGDPDFDGQTGEGNNIHYGVREHAMAAIANGMAYHGGVRPFVATFFCFSDYMRPSVRLAALNHLSTIFVWTHDSIGLGEDGPTHQAVEQLMSLRAMPYFSIIRPGDANETAEAWRATMEHREGAVGLVLCRQNIPVLDRSGAKGDVSRGAYILAEASGGKPKIILIGTGSELQLAVGGRQKLEAEGVPTRVVSMPCWEFFDDAAPRVSRRGPAAGRSGAALDRSRRDAGLAEIRGRQGWVHRRRPLRRVGARRSGHAGVRLHGRPRRGVRPRIAPKRRRRLMSANPLKRLGELGQSVWYDYIRRDLYTSPKLRQLIDEDGLKGMTSNPTIFQNAIAKSDLYDDDIRSAAGKDPAAIYEQLAVTDVRAAADQFRPVFDAADGSDGFVSIEVGPHEARDTQDTIAEARRLWKACGRANVMVKIPGTAEGVPAIRQCLSEGININVTLLFGVPRYREVMEAYLSALEERVKKGEPIDRIRSVASFFVSRVDTNVDAKLDALIAKGNAAAKPLRAKIGVANARVAYEAFEEVFGGSRFAALKAKGARVQKPLWASTSTKDKTLPDVYYVEALIAPDSVDTVPPETFEAYRDHGNPKVRIHDDLDAAHAAFAALPGLGIDFDTVTRELEDEGVKKFSDSYDSLLQAIAAKEKSMRVA